MKITERNIHKFYAYTLFTKAVISLVQLLSGALLLLVNQKFIIKIVSLLTQEELKEDAQDFVANYLISMAQNLSLSIQHFFALYLILHGLIKIALVIGLLREKRWAYPVSIIIFIIFIIYQLYKYTVTQSLSFLLLSAFDILIIYLVSREYILLRNKGNENFV